MNIVLFKENLVIGYYSYYYYYFFLYFLASDYSSNDAKAFVFAVILFSIFAMFDMVALVALIYQLVELVREMALEEIRLVVAAYLMLSLIPQIRTVAQYEGNQEFERCTF